MDEHGALLDQAELVRQELSRGRLDLAHARMTALLADLDRHIRREETGVFSALRAEGEFVDEIDALEGEHREMAAALAGLAFPAGLVRVLDHLAAHVEREDLGIFPVSVVTLGAAGWSVVEAAHAASPSFLCDPLLKEEMNDAGVVD